MISENQNWNGKGKAVLLLLSMAGYLLIAGPVGACCVCTGCASGPAIQCLSTSAGCEPQEEFICGVRCVNEFQCEAGDFSRGSCVLLAACGFTVPTSRFALQLLLALALLGSGVYYLRRGGGPQAARAAVMTATLLAGVGALYAGSQLAVTGVWQAAGSQTQQALQAAQWEAQLTLGADDSLSGPVTVSGSPRIGSGSFQGKIAGSTVSGAINDAAGNRVATVTGTVHEGVFQGQYTTTDGATGTFTWDNIGGL